MSLEHHFSSIPEFEGAGTTLVLGWRGLIRIHYCLFRQHVSVGCEEEPFASLVSGHHDS